MKKLFIPALLLFVFSSMVFAVPPYLTMLGIARDNSGNLITGTRSMSFNIYDAASGGTLIYGPQNEAAVIVNGGEYSVQLGPITSAMFNGEDRYLEVAIGGTIISPRRKINPVAYAVTADTLGGHSASLTSSAGKIPYMDAGGKLDSTVIPTSSSPTNADTLDGFHAGISGAGIVPTTDATGLLALSTIPAVSTAKIQDTAVTGGKLASDINITTTGTVAATYIKPKYFLTSGTGTGYCVGTDTITAGFNNKVVNNTLATNNSLIFVTPSPLSTGSTTMEALVVEDITTGVSFRIGFYRNASVAPAGGLPFNYLIIN